MRASWALSAMTDSEWPSRSCRSRAKRSRSSATARRATSARASTSSRLVRMISPIATIAAPMPSRPRACPQAALVLPPPAVAVRPGRQRGDRQHDDVPWPRQAQGAHGHHVVEEEVPVGPVGDGQRAGDDEVDDVGARDDRRRLGVHPAAHGLEEEGEEDDERGGDDHQAPGAGLVAQQPDDGGQRDEDREDARDARRGHPEAIRELARSARHLPLPEAHRQARAHQQPDGQHEEVVARPGRAVVERVEGDVQGVGQALDREELRQRRRASPAPR